MNPLRAVTIMSAAALSQSMAGELVPEPSEPVEEQEMVEVEAEEEQILDEEEVIGIVSDDFQTEAESYRLMNEGINDDDEYVITVAESVSDENGDPSHIATLNRYYVNKHTGEFWKEYD
ncbi:hypothetical protein [Geomicrobium sp. JCM 19037]|uniref:hypothetical protein n=1 Tax=Geomicrobium sp. JCM 19037 TaxID=1460634 RepID=UPI0005A836DB|nr:hypothetical protein [Geomicrobium sp. JCM 19037]